MNQTKAHPALVVPILVFCWLLFGVLLATGVVLILLYRDAAVYAFGGVLIGASALVMCCAAVASVQAYRQFCKTPDPVKPLYKDLILTNNYE